MTKTLNSFSAERTRNGGWVVSDTFGMDRGTRPAILAYTSDKDFLEALPQLICNPPTFIEPISGATGPIEARSSESGQDLVRIKDMWFPADAVIAA